MMLSRQPITSEMVHTPFLIRSWALPFHTSVPWDRPEIWIRSLKFLGWASMQHLPHERRAQFRDAEGAGLAVDLLRGDTQRLGGGTSRLITRGSFMGTWSMGMPVMSSRYLYMVGTSWPSSSSLSRVSCRYLNSKWVVRTPLSLSSAGCWMGQKS